MKICALENGDCRTYTWPCNYQHTHTHNFTHKYSNSFDFKHSQAKCDTSDDGIWKYGGVYVFISDGYTLGRAAGPSAEIMPWAYA